jgi:hypothetical protein
MQIYNYIIQSGDDKLAFQLDNSIKTKRNTAILFYFISLNDVKTYCKYVLDRNNFLMF